MKSIGEFLLFSINDSNDILVKQVTNNVTYHQRQQTKNPAWNYIHLLKIDGWKMIPFLKKNMSLFMVTILIFQVVFNSMGV